MNWHTANLTSDAGASPWRRSLARPLRTLVASAAAGIVTTLVVVWPLPLLLLAYGVIGHKSWSVDTFWTTETHGGHYTQSHLALSDWVIMKRIIFTGGAAAQPYYMQNPPPPWACVLALDGSDGFEEVHTAATGWPWRAMASESWQRWTPALGQASEELRHNLVLASLPRGRIILPLRPIWGGLAADVGVWTCAWVPLLIVPGVARRFLRRRRNRCMGCGYDVRGLAPGGPCPECGLARA